jgi:Uma2 family endonuclease
MILTNNREVLMSSAAKNPYITPDDYLARERVAEIKNEYHDGQIYAMSGASRPHNLITVNLCRHIANQLADRPCELYVGDMRVRVDLTGLYTYPDITVVCGTPRFEDGKFDTLLNPDVIIEILSPSTESWDRGAKFFHYRRLESLNDYVLVSQDKVLVERYTRQGEQWLLTVWSRLEDSLQLPSIGCEVALRDIYAKVPLETEA